ncbi:MAG: HEPN domain-containing protein [Gemmatimonadaceae bacterium]
MANVKLDHPPIADTVDAIVRLLKPRRVILYGSHARGDARHDSDIDLLVEIDAGEGLEESRAIVEQCKARDWETDILIVTPQHLARACDDVGSVIYDVVREGKVLYRRADVETAIARVRETPSGPPATLGWWVQHAEQDFEIVEQCAAMGSPPWSSTAFLAHESAEKLLKASLIARNVRPRRTHDLRRLLASCVEAGLGFEHLAAACDVLQQAWPRSRYPVEEHGAVLPPITESEGRAAVAAVRAIREAVLPLLPR